MVHELALPTLSGGLGTFTMQGASPPPQTDVFPISASVPKFPACDGLVLHGVRVRLATTTSAQLQASSQPGSMTSVSGTLAVQPTLAGAGFTSSGSGPVQQGGPVMLSSANGYQAYLSLAPVTSTAIIEVSVPSSALGAYVGTGMATFGGQVLFGQGGSSSSAPVSIQFFRNTTRILSVTYTFTTPPADVNGDQTVDALDLGIVLAAWGSKSSGSRSWMGWVASTGNCSLAASGTAPRMWGSLVACPPRCNSM